MKPTMSHAIQQAFSHAFIKVAIAASATTLSSVAGAQETSTAFSFALSALHKACEPYVSSADQSLEAADLALYCLSTGQTMVLQNAETFQQQLYAKQTITQWIEELQPALAPH